MNNIKNIYAREILDSRGNPTVEVELTLDSGDVTIAQVPSGASTGEHEALELRDNDLKRYNGKGVLKAVSNVNTIIKDKLIGMSPLKQKEIDTLLINLDGTPDKSNLGANAILGVSLAVLKAGAIIENKPLYKYVHDLYNREEKMTIPRCMMNILNGGVHAENNLDIQEFMIIPSLNNYLDNLRIGAEIFHSLKKVLQEKGYSCGVGDEGGFAPNINSTDDALNLISEAISRTNYKLGKDVFFGMDVAASELYHDGKYQLDSQVFTANDLVGYYEELTKKYPIISIEDGMAEDDFDGWKKLTEVLGNKVQLVGDDLFVTNKKRLQEGIDLGIANAILIKLNQIGTVTETIETIKLARDNNYNMIISHRSGETEDNYIADIAVGLNLGQIKTGSMSRSERLSKYNELIRINEKIR